MLSYGIYDTSTKLIKLGKTKNLSSFKSRISAFRTANPNLKLIFLTSLYSESELHSKFKYLNRYLEWFELDNNLINFINNQIVKNCEYDLTNIALYVKIQFKLLEVNNEIY